MSIFIVIWIRREITNHYKHKANERTIENQQKIIEEQKQEIERLYTVSKISHKTNHEIDTLKNKIKNMTNEEALNELNQIATNYRTAVKKTTKKGLLQNTNIKEIDETLEYMKNLAEENEITFILKLNGSINYMINKLISKEKLVTLLSDHLKNAIISIHRLSIQRLFCIKVMLYDLDLPKLPKKDHKA